jgi:thiamine biosynthesis lipoprotein ApbE
VIDPRTATPTASDISAVSVVAQTAADAEILTTTILVNGLQASVALLTGGATALVTLSDGHHQRTVGWPPESLDHQPEARLIS